MNYKLLLLIILFIILLVKSTNNKVKFTNYYSDIQMKYNDLGEFEKENLLKSLIDINKNNYKNYKENKIKLNKKNPTFKFGYSELENVNQDLIGFCPLGHYFKGKYVNNKDLLKKCKKCFVCNKKPGYYTSGGCVGDKDSKCDFGKIPMNIYLDSHIYPYYNHNLLSQHKHKYDYKLDNNNITELCPTPSSAPCEYETDGEFIYKTTDNIHKHY